MGELIAVRADAATAGAALQRIWADGDAALFLPLDAPEPTIAAVLAAQRPSAFVDLRSGPDAPRRRLPDPLPTDDAVALVVSTSGSTGIPKGVELSHAALRASTAASIERLGCAPGDRWFAALPVHHVAGVQVLLRAWALGTEPVVVAGQEGITRGAMAMAAHISLVPTQLRRLLDAWEDVSGFATILLGGAHADAGLLGRARAAGANVVVSYGMTETAGGCVYDGLPLDGTEIDVVEGRVRLRGPTLFRGYRGTGRPTAFAIDAAGWFTTGDLGRMRDGRLEVLGRADDVVVTGGENVPMVVVEEALRASPDVSDVAVTSRADPDWGQALIAVVVAADPRTPPTLAALRALVRRSHPRAFAPRELLLVPALPRDQLGKLSRGALEQLVRPA